MIDLSALFGVTDFLSSLFGNNKKTEKPAVQTPVTWAAQQGPTGYTDAMRANLGLDVQQGGQSPTSGMAAVSPNAGTPYWYDPVAAQANPLQALLGVTPMPTTPAPTPTTPTPTTLIAPIMP